MEIRFFSSEENLDQIKNTVSNTITKYNDESEANNRNKGVVHNYNFTAEKDFLRLRIDTSSAGINIINDLLKRLKTITEISKVEIDL